MDIGMDRIVSGKRPMNFHGDGGNNLCSTRTGNLQKLNNS
jgi:hypothetical protein